MSEFYMKVAGVTHEGRQRIVARLQPGEPLQFVPEPDNPYDDHAVGIRKMDGQQIGYIPKEQNRQIFENLVNGRGEYKVSVSAVTGGGFGAVYGCNIRVEYDPNHREKQKSNPEQDIWRLQERIDATGDADAECELGKILMGYNGAKPDFQRAAALLQSAARKNHAEAQNYLGILYFNGLGIPKNATKARFWLEESAKNNNRKAKRNLEVYFDVKD